MDWDTFKHMFQTRFILSGYIDCRKNEFTELKQGKMSAKSTIVDSPTYHIISLRLSLIPRRCFACSRREPARNDALHTYQEFYEILLRVEDSENALDDDKDSGGMSAPKRYDRGQSSLGPRKTQKFKRSGNNSGSSSYGSKSGTPRRGGSSIGSSRF